MDGKKSEAKAGGTVRVRPARGPVGAGAPVAAGLALAGSRLVKARSGGCGQVQRADEGLGGEEQRQ